MRCIILSCILCLILAYFSILFHKVTISEKIYLTKIFFLNSCTNLFCKVSYSKKKSDRYLVKLHFSLCNHCNYLVKHEFHTVFGNA